MMPGFSQAQLSLSEYRIEHASFLRDGQQTQFIAPFTPKHFMKTNYSSAMIEATLPFSCYLLLPSFLPFSFISQEASTRIPNKNQLVSHAELRLQRTMMT